MLLSFECPGCGKSYERPLSLAGKKARCKQCGGEFIIPAPGESRNDRPSAEIEVTRAAPIYAIEATPPARPAASPRRVPPEEAVPFRAPATLERRPAEAPAARPARLIPSIAGGVVLIAALNIGFYFALYPRSATVDRIRETPAPDAVDEPVRVAEVANEAEPPTAPKAGPAPTAVASIPPPAEPPRERPMSTAEIVRDYEPSVALIQGKSSSGTGFIVRPNVVATNSHVIDGETVGKLEVRFPSAPEGKRGPYSARLLFQDKGRDLALLSVICDLPPTAVAESYKFLKGDDVTVIGNPGVGGRMVLENAVSRGVVSSMTSINGHSFLQLGISINPGNSGGPVFDSTGRVIGVVTLKTTKQEGLAFAVPSSDLLAALATSRDPGSPIIIEASQGPVVTASDGTPDLMYRWKAGETYVYAFDLTVGDTGGESVTVKGSSIYRVKSTDAEGTTLGHRSWLFATKRGKDGRVPTGGVAGPKVNNEVELKLDAKGGLLAGSGSSPLPLLGDLSMLIIEPFPDGPVAKWDDAQTIGLTQVEQVPGQSGGGTSLGRPGLDGLARGGSRSRLTPRSRPGSDLRSRLDARSKPAPRPQPAPQPQLRVVAHEASEETSYTLGATTDGKAPIRKTYELITAEKIGKQPRLKMTGEGTISFGIPLGVPLAMNYEVRVVEVTPTTTIRIPIRVSATLLEGKKRDEALKPPSRAPSAMNPTDAGEVSRMVAALKSTDPSRRREACRALQDAAPIPSRRDDVSRALERLLDDRDAGLRGEAVRALGIWADAGGGDALIRRLGDANFGLRDELFEAVGRASPDAKGAEAIVPWLAREAGRAVRALREIGGAAEGPLLRAVAGSPDIKARSEACKLLKDLGGSESVPVLERVAGQGSDGEVGRAAEEAVRSIERRWPGDDEWAALLRDVRSPDGGRRRQAADAILKAEPVAARRDSVRRALEALAGDVDGGLQSLAIRGLAAWGDGGSRAVLIAQLGDPDLRPSREAIEALAKLGPDPRAAEAIARRVSKDHGTAIEALATMGPIAEPAALVELKSARIDDRTRDDLINLLGRIGSRASVPALRELASGRNGGGGAQRAIAAIESTPEGQGVAGIEADLNSGDRDRRSRAVRRLAFLPPTDADRPSIARALDGLWDVDDLSLKRSLRDAVVRWGDDASVEALADRLARPDLRQWEEALQALARLRPDARTAGLAVARLSQDAGVVAEVGKLFGVEIERPLLARAQGTGAPRSRADACRALGLAGTPSALPDLKTLAARAGVDQLAREAEDALRAIRSRL